MTTCGENVHSVRRLRLWFIAVGALLGVIGAAMLFYAYYVYSPPDEVGGKEEQTLLSPNGKWQAREYYIGWDVAFDGGRSRVVVRRVGRGAWKQVYAGSLVDIKWRGQAELVIREEESRATYVIHPARGEACKDYPFGIVGGVIGMLLVFGFFVGLAWLLSTVVVRRPTSGR